MKNIRKKILTLVCALVCTFSFMGCSSKMVDNMGDFDFMQQVPSSGFDSDTFEKIMEQSFVETAEQPTSSFRMSVSTSSYTYVRNSLNNRALPQADAVRIEDFVNYFSYDLHAPENGTFNMYSNVYSCPWNSDGKLLRISVKAKEIERAQTASNLVFLIDSSGSMSGGDRLELIKKAFGYLADNLGENDRVSVVTYAGSSRILLSGESGQNTRRIKGVIDELKAGGSTGGASGITTAYNLARDNYIDGGNNRVILATDGDFNVGISDPVGLTSLIKTQRDSGIYFTGIGVGFGNYHDTTMQALANSGNGQALYIDNESEAKKVFTEGLTGTLFTVAKDAKTQVVFNADRVQKYRLLGYDNLVLSQEEFEDGYTDAGEVGSGHIVTAVYEIIPTAATEGNFAAAEIRYKDVDSNENKSEKTDIVSADANTDDKFIACVLEGALLLRRSEYKGTANYSSVIERLTALNLTDEYKQEFLQLIKIAKDIR